ncbi:hypothetical protein [uncultured Psychroserpens sp.]|uniref:hypothetical protein n=1 Tax=uncultured Psychroserpens sp. TaxID=255436 RepID=UPI00260EE201|nr:hypothetical protein [uncultured Psychroserpens sp.]
MVFYILLIIFLLAIIYLLLVPIVFYIDTSTNQYFIKIKGLLKASIEPDEAEIFKIHFKVFFFNFFVYPLQKKKRSKTKAVKTNTSKKRGDKRIPFKKVFRVLKSFKIKQFQLDIDTGDCISNSKLYPIFAFLNFYRGHHLGVNYEGRNKILLSVENRPIRMIRSFINI